MQAFPFWIMDVSPGPIPPFVVFTPTFGFSACSSPEMSLETEDHNQGNWYFPRPTVRRALVSPITLSRGARFFDADFYRWIRDALVGRNKPRRNLLLLHYLGYTSGALEALTEGERLGITPVSGDALSALGIGPTPDGPQRIPGRAWMLYDCIPTRYKAASDFDARSSEVSVMELEVKPTYFEEYPLASPSPL